MKDSIQLPQAFYGVIQGGKVVMLPADDGQWLNKTSVAEAFRALEQRAEGAEAKLTDLAKQKPIGAFHIRDQDVEATSDYVDTGQWPVDNGVIEVFTRAAPATDLAELVPDELTPKQASRSYGGEVVGYRDGWNACRATILRNIAQVDRDKFFKFLKNTSSIVDSWPDWKKQGTDVVKFLNPSPSAEVVDESCPKGSVHEWVHHAPCYKADYEECNKCGQRKECSENE